MAARTRERLQIENSIGLFRLRKEPRWLFVGSVFSKVFGAITIPAAVDCDLAFDGHVQLLTFWVPSLVPQLLKNDAGPAENKVGPSPRAGGSLGYVVGLALVIL